MIKIGNVSVPRDHPEVTLEVRVVDGVLALFTERGEFVNWQKTLTVKSDADQAQTVIVELFIGDIKHGWPPR